VKIFRMKIVELWNTLAMILITFFNKVIQREDWRHWDAGYGSENSRRNGLDSQETKRRTRPRTSRS